MSLEDIKRLHFKCARAAVCFLWAVNPLLPEALQVLAAWGFQYKSNLVWDKTLQGLGYWVRGQHEILLIGVRGKFPTPPQGKRLSSVYRCKRGRHSEKPLFIREYLTDVYPKLNKLELFARPDLFRAQHEAAGWRFWGKP
jgi:N6-adenosine-specific RNA methylase IME4